MIKVVYTSIDGCRVARTFKSLKGARAFAQKYVGKNPDMGSSYAVSFDGIGKIQAFSPDGGKLMINTQEIVLADLFGDEPLPARKIIVGAGENHTEMVVDDQETLRLIAEVIDYLPDRDT